MTMQLHERPNGLAKQGAAPPTIKQMVADPTIQKKLAQVAHQLIKPEKLAQAMLLAVNRTPALQKCSAASLLDCLMVAGQYGWTIGGPRPGLYMVPYGNTATPIPSYYGLQETARRSGQEWEIEAEVVREGDDFQYCKGLVPVLEHRPHDEVDAVITHAYAIARSKDGRTKFDVMRVEEIEKIRKRSKAGNNGPWVSDYAEMCKKTVTRRLCKYLPSSPEMDAALELSDEAERGEHKPETVTVQSAKPSLDDFDTGAAGPTDQTANVAGLTNAAPAKQTGEDAHDGPTTVGEDAPHPSSPVSDDPRSAEDKAEDYVNEVPVETLTEWLTTIPKDAFKEALVAAGVTVKPGTALTDAQVRHVAYFAKLSQLTKESR